MKKTAIEMFKEHKAKQDGYKTTQAWIVDAMEEFALQFEDDNGRANYYEDKIEGLINQMNEMQKGIDNIKFKGISPDKNEKLVEIIKYHAGLPSKYQPPSNYKFYGDGNDEIINAVIG